MKAAFIDIDYCLVGLNTTLEFTKHLLKNGHQSLWRLIPLTLLYLLFQLRLFPQSWLFYLYVLTLRGLELERLRSLAVAFTRERIAPLLAGPIRAEIEDLKKEGYLIVLATGSIELTALPLGRLIGADEVLATRLAEKNGLLTGKLDGGLNYGYRKWRGVLEFALLKGIDLAGSSAFSDHYSDIPLLEAVGCPVAVNPDFRLRRLARKRGWRLLEDRG